MSVLFVCMPVHFMHDCRSRRTERALDRHPGTEDTRGCEPHVGDQAGPLREHKVVLTIETSFPSHVSQIFKQNWM